MAQGQTLQKPFCRKARRSRKAAMDSCSCDDWPAPLELILWSWGVASLLYWVWSAGRSLMKICTRSAAAKTYEEAPVQTRQATAAQDIVQRRSNVPEAPPAVIYAVPNARRSYHLSSECWHLKEATHEAVKYALCKDCAKLQRRLQSNLQ